MTVAEPVAREVKVRVEPLSQEGGHWCVRCCLTTGIVAWIAVYLGDRMHLQQRTWCPQCLSGAHVVIDEMF